MSRAVAVVWSKQDKAAIADGVRRLLVGFGASVVDDEMVETYMEVLEGISPAHVLEGVGRLRRSPGAFRPTPGQVRQAALEPAPEPPRARGCDVCGYPACVCAATAESKEQQVQVEAMVRSLMDKLGS